MLQYNWPGNIRELKNAIEYSFNVGDGDLIGIAELPDNIISYNYANTEADSNLDIGKELAQLDALGLNPIIELHEKQIIIELLKSSDSLSHAAKRAQITRQALKYKIDKYGINYEELLNNHM